MTAHPTKRHGCRAAGRGWRRRDDLLRGFLPRRLREAGLIARADDRGDSVLQIAPPLNSDADLLDEIVDRLGEVLAEAGAHMLAGMVESRLPSTRCRLRPSGR